ncbi:type II toxin-antitoxin system VapC family toxin [Helicobacter magdeburgensis]|uniref:Ribonuclease VapC n=1 Tax=Helicobacter magdeburgensis TaxID=471858 RepID=A0A4U8T239_9HELI|nr:type II toxin-antitoxin system VapC family toxin [Helicobacter magdeburgensis]TLD93465.1 type II toxin-antitoxin system VapC family toxin [Helicobacter magdeburgensis]
MAKIMLDTNICIYILNNKPEYIKGKFLQYRIGDVAISSISVAELYFGVEKSRFKEPNTIALSAFLANLEVVNFGNKEASVYASVRADLERKKSLIGSMDMLIAATAIANNLVLITNNTKEFERVQNLNIENWIKKV